jgi:hypothetical protein
MGMSQALESGSMNGLEQRGHCSAAQADPDQPEIAHCCNAIFEGFSMQKAMLFGKRRMYS